MPSKSRVHDFRNIHDWIIERLDETKKDSWIMPGQKDMKLPVTTGST